MSRLPLVAAFLSALLAWAPAAPAGPPASAGPPAHLPDELLIGFHAGLGEAEEENAYRGHGALKLQRLRGLAVHRVRVPAHALEQIERTLRRHPHVKFVERNGIVAPDQTADDPYFASAYHLARIEAPAAWDLTVGSPGVVIAILDSGVDPAHPDLAAKLVPGYNTYDGNTATADVYGHGTKVAGAAAAIGNNAVGVTGVAWDARLMPVRVTDTAGYGYYSTIASGLTWAADHGARVMNVSFAGVAGSSTIASAAQYARSRGGVVVTAAGNCGCVDPTAENPYLLSVSATDASDALASWSSRGPYVDLAAPGAGIYTTTSGGGYASVSGTSFASPVTAGVVALMLSANPDLAPADVETLLETSADDLGATGWDQSYGAGRVNAYRAVAAAATGAPPPDTTPPSASIAAPSDGADVAGSVTVSVAATDDRGVTRVDVFADGALVGSDTTAPYGVVWDTRQAANGAHILSAVAHDAAGNAGPPAEVAVTVANPTDTTAPAVSLASVSTRRHQLTVQVTATDDVGVVRVELYVDGALVATDTAAAWGFTVNLKRYATGPHAVQARAYDAAGNAGVSATQTFVK